MEAKKSKVTYSYNDGVPCVLNDNQKLQAWAKNKKCTLIFNVINIQRDSKIYILKDNTKREELEIKYNDVNYVITDFEHIEVKLINCIFGDNINISHDK